MTNDIYSYSDSYQETISYYYQYKYATSNQKENYCKLCLLSDIMMFDLEITGTTGYPYTINLNKTNIIKVTNDLYQPMPNKKGIINLKELSKIKFDRKKIILTKHNPCDKAEIRRCVHPHEKTMTITIIFIQEEKSERSLWTFKIIKNSQPTLKSVLFYGDKQAPHRLSGNQLINLKYNKKHV